MYTKGLLLRIEVPMQLILYPVTSNSHKECSVLYLMHAHKYVQK